MAGFQVSTEAYGTPVELSPRETATCVIEIMRTLAIQDMLNEWDFVFDEKGLRVSVKNPSMIKHVVPQEHFMFEDTEAFAE